ncbi:MAG: DUF4111 domain-containing protein [Chloroflexota bacterium]|nr:DUF4111 domain-containing protein [Chloroflexota bacterium]
MNYNIGRGEVDHLSLDPPKEASHWFLLDIAMGHEHGRSLSGPPPADVFASIPRCLQLEAIADSLASHRVHESASINSALNACRGWRYAVTGVHGSKRVGAMWARQQSRCPSVVQEAEQRRHGGPPLDAGAVIELTAIVMEAVQTAIRQERGTRNTGLKKVTDRQTAVEPNKR